MNLITPIFVSQLVEEVLQELKSRREEADVSYFLQSSSSLFLESQFNYAITSCNHIVHFHCLQAMIKRRTNRVHKHFSEFTCPVCRRLMSRYIPLILPATINPAFRQRYSNLKDLLQHYSIPVNQSVYDVGG